MADTREEMARAILNRVISLPSGPYVGDDEDIDRFLVDGDLDFLVLADAALSCLKPGARFTVDGVEVCVVPVEPTTTQLDRAVAFALNVSLGGDYRWTDYMRDLYAGFLRACEES